MNLEYLRRETSAAHDSVEEAIPLMRPHLTIKEYTACLRRMHGIVTTWEQVAIDSSAGWLRELVIKRQRAHLLTQDLRFFGSLETDGERPVLPRMNDQVSLLGTMYVMEGSKLGGKFIARHVRETLGMGSGAGSAFFRDGGRQTGLLWKEFCDVLRTRVPDRESEQVIQSAQEMFNVFRSWMNDPVNLPKSIASVSAEKHRAHI
jgi:heme oxygenase